MKITPKWEYVEGSFDTETVKLVCVAKEKYDDVILCVEEEGRSSNFGFAEITLNTNGCDKHAVFDDAKKLGEEIARRWNEAKDKK
ncbi:MAG: hypothetical protein LBP40_02600 [Campylobacteraceae bacterium]|jgi:hypothetical protein|nr:hypothetical protein [Campylobacteraceae bacterium]